MKVFPFFAKLTGGALLLSLAMLNQGCTGNPDPDNPTDESTISADIRASRTLTDRVSGDAVDYTVTGNIKITNSAVLTVAPGVIIAFKQNAGFEIEEGALKAVGTAEKPIMFTGVQKTKGYWNGLFFINSNDVNNELTYCTVEYAGSDNYLYEEGNVVVGSNDYGRARIKLNNTTIRNSQSMGMYVSKESFVDGMTNCTFTSNDNAPIRVEAPASDQISDKTTSSFSGNTENYIIIDGDPYGGDKITKNITWKKLNVPYAIKHEINLEKTLTLEAGVEVLGMSNAGFRADGEDAKEGKIVALGTSTNLVRMNGVQATPGYWKGIFLWGGDADLTYCVIDNAGSYATFDYSSKLGAVVAESYYDQVSNLKMTNCTISNSEHYGICVDSAPDAGSGGVSSSFIDVGTIFSNCSDGTVYQY